jgi:putative PIN family toxin of toxin-antitoxin system
MQKVILDTNVVVSALIQKNYPYIIEHCIDGNAVICLSDSLLQEYIEVFNRPKFSRFTDFKANADFMITRLSEIAQMYETKIKENLIEDDADNRLLELAHSCQADFIITGNTKDFNMNYYGDTKIVQPRDYWENLK